MIESVHLFAPFRQAQQDCSGHYLLPRTPSYKHPVVPPWPASQKGWKACLHHGRRSETVATAAAGEKKPAARQNSACAGSRVRLYNQSLMVALPATGGAQQDLAFTKIAPRFK